MPNISLQRGQDYLYKGVDVPDLATVKGVLRFYMATSRGKIDEDERPTANSVNTFAEWFFAGFTWVKATPTDNEDRGEVYNVSNQPNQPNLPQFARNDLVEQGHVVNMHRPKHLFTWRDLTCLLVTLWTLGDLIFIPERYRLQYTLIIRVRCYLQQSARAQRALNIETGMHTSRRVAAGTRPTRNAFPFVLLLHHTPDLIYC
jgi:hypothetical protein